MKSKRHDIEQITIRRAAIVDADKVRYRVYSTPTEFIAVIAESALMAVKVAGISKPHKIVRDLPTDGIAIEAKKMAAIQENPQRIALPMQPSSSPQRLMTDLAPVDMGAKKAAFRPMMLGDLQRTQGVRARILPPEMLSQIIEEHTKAISGAPLSAVTEASAANLIFEQPEEEALSPNDRLLKMSQEVLASAPESVAIPASELSPEEVEKLLNG